VIASDKAVTDPQGARRLGYASYIVSSVGILVTGALLAFIFSVVDTS